MPTLPDSPSQPTAIITGGSSGIGRAAAIVLARAGYRCAVIARRADELVETVRLCNEAAPTHSLPGGGAGVQPHIPQVCDLALPGLRASVFTDLVTKLGRVDVLVNCAGVARLAPIEKTTNAMLTEAFELNTVATAAAISAVWPTMQRAKGGVIVNISSMAALDPFPGFFAYAAAKAAVNMLTVVAVREGSRHNIRAYAICPGAVETEMLRSMFNEKVVPREKAIAPAAVGELVLACVRGERPSDGKPIPIHPQCQLG
ncbi:SDR family oxidoreductase [soil metagenome]